jgi:Family of unknown function (DUF6520)
LIPNKSLKGPNAVFSKGLIIPTKGGIVMKKLLVILSLLAFVVSISPAFAREPSQERQAEPQINCCFQDGQCLKTKRENCSLKQGIVVSDCKDCPGVWGKGKKK